VKFHWSNHGAKRVIADREEFMKFSRSKTRAVAVPEYWTRCRELADLPLHARLALVSHHHAQALSTEQKKNLSRQTSRASSLQQTGDH
jgi:hypothetical protein